MMFKRLDACGRVAVLGVVFAMAFANLIGLFVFAPSLRRELDQYWAALSERNN